MVESLRSLLIDTAACQVRGLEEVVAVREMLDRIEAQWLAGLHDVVVSGEAESTTGMAITDCLAEHTRRTRRQSRSWISLSKRLAATHMVDDELAAGGLSLGQATMLMRGRTTRTAEFFDEQETFLVEIAKTLSPDQLDDFMNQWYRRADAATADSDDADARTRRELFLAPVGSTEWALRGTLTAEQGELVNEALSAIAEADWDGAGDARPMPQRRVDALASLSKFCLDMHRDMGSLSMDGR